MNGITIPQQNNSLATECQTIGIYQKGLNGKYVYILKIHSYKHSVEGYVK